MDVVIEVVFLTILEKIWTTLSQTLHLQLAQRNSQSKKCNQCQRRKVKLSNCDCFSFTSDWLKNQTPSVRLVRVGIAHARSGKSTRLQPMWPGSEFSPDPVSYVSEMLLVLSFFPPSTKPLLPPLLLDFNSIWNTWPHRLPALNTTV